MRRACDLTVVLVEPSRAQVSIAREFLHKLGIGKVHGTGSGKEAIELAHRERADVRLSAPHLADMTGFQLAELLHADAACRDIGFVLASSETYDVDPGDLPSFDRVVPLRKPYDLRRLEHALALATGRRPRS